MGVSASIEKLSRTVERYEADGGEIHRVDATIRGDGDEPSVAIDVVVPLCSAAGQQPSEAEAEATPRAATIGEDGGLCLEFPPSIVPEIDEFAPADASCVTEDATVTSEGTVAVTFELGLETDAKRGREATGDAESERNAGESADPTDRERSERAAPVDSLEEAVATDESTPEPAAESEDDRASESRDGSASDSVASDADDDESDATVDDETERALAAARNDDLPPYDDVEYLECLYDSFETFTAMAEALEMDVASETVRRYMIDAGIHEPTSYETTAPDEDDATTDDGDDSETTAGQRDRSADADRESTADADDELDRSATAEGPAASVSEKQLVADGIGLPDGVEIDELMDAIESSMTLHDVTRELDLERGRTRELLEQLNLLDLVVKRVYDSADPERHPSRNEIADRIRESVTHGQ